TELVEVLSKPILIISMLKYFDRACLEHLILRGENKVFGKYRKAQYDKELDLFILSYPILSKIRVCLKYRLKAMLECGQLLLYETNRLSASFFGLFGSNDCMINLIVFVSSPILLE